MNTLFHEKERCVQNDIKLIDSLISLTQNGISHVKFGKAVTINTQFTGVEVSWELQLAQQLY
jgi:hypothetical protein